MGLYMLVFLGGAPLGSPLVGWAAEQFGARAGLIGGGVISAAAAVGVAFLLARARGARLRSACARPCWPAPRADGGGTYATRAGQSPHNGYARGVAAATNGS